MAERPRIIKRSWKKEEDAALLKLVEEYGSTCQWSTISSFMDNRTGKQCRERYHNHLKTGIVKEKWSEKEDEILENAHKLYGNQWAKIARLLPGRSDNCVKNRWHIVHRTKRIQRLMTNNEGIIPVYVQRTKRIPKSMSKNTTPAMSSPALNNTINPPSNSDVCVTTDIQDFEYIWTRSFDPAVHNSTITNFNNTLGSNFSGLTGDVLDFIEAEDLEVGERGEEEDIEDIKNAKGMTQNNKDNHQNNENDVEFDHVLEMIRCDTSVESLSDTMSDTGNNDSYIFDEDLLTINTKDEFDLLRNSISLREFDRVLLDLNDSDEEDNSNNINTDTNTTNITHSSTIPCITSNSNTSMTKTKAYCISLKSTTLNEYMDVGLGLGLYEDMEEINDYHQQRCHSPRSPIYTTGSCLRPVKRHRMDDMVS